MQNSRRTKASSAVERSASTSDDAVAPSARVVDEPLPRPYRAKRSVTLDREKLLAQIAEAAQDPETADDGLTRDRPKTRLDCRDGVFAARPCPFVGCKYHLYLDQKSQKTGTLILNYPDLDPTELTETCALDVAERGHRTQAGNMRPGQTLVTVGHMLNMTRERIRQIQITAMKHARRLDTHSTVEVLETLDEVARLPERTSASRDLALPGVVVRRAAPNDLGAGGRANPSDPAESKLYDELMQKTDPRRVGKGG